MARPLIQREVAIMRVLIEKEVPLAGGSIVIGATEWIAPAAWVCPAESYVVCQRISEGHSALRLVTESVRNLEVYPQVRSLGFMPSTRAITMYPIERPLRTLNCFFDKALFEEATQIDANGWYDRAGSFLTLSSPAVEKMMTTIHRELIDPGFGSEQMIEAASTMIAIEMARLGQMHGGAHPSAPSAHGLAPWQLRRIRERLDAALEQGYPSIQELAAICGISRGHLMRMFKVSTGEALQRFITLERLGKARRMLAEDRLSVKEIAAVLHFCNTAHFSNAFRRAEGITPSEYRMRSRAGLCHIDGYTASSKIH
ncbi:helix-turn-helix domain-containing protein [Novosphingobium sp. M1R2S20]|uniref:Helix-turn-helix domain-containing protein n=1 Tax=Novosphingobium rhizovicinum TaxID=3228928 RepID=A0ABV3REU7_9SPHN